MTLISSLGNISIPYSGLSCSAVPEVEDSCYQAIQHNGEEQWNDVENGEVDEVDGQVELPFDFVATLHMSILVFLNITQLSETRLSGNRQLAHTLVLG